MINRDKYLDLQIAKKWNGMIEVVTGTRRCGKSYLLLKLNQIIYFGDGPNDLEVFKMLPFSITMGDCFPELLKYATYQIDTCKNDGVANFIIENYHV